MTTPMIERLARAIYNVDPIMDQNVDPDDRPVGPKFPISWETVDEVPEFALVRENTLKAVRAVLAEMREPSPRPKSGS